jgi:hypothetical protein
MSDVDIWFFNRNIRTEKTYKKPDDEVEELTAGVDVSTITVRGHGVHVYNLTSYF